MKKRQKQLAAGALACVSMAGLAVPAVVYAAPAAYAAEAAQLNPYGTPAKEAIREAFETYRYSEIVDSAVSYAEKPVVSPAGSLQAGRLSDETIQNALDAVNLFRFVAGLDEVTENPVFSDAAQHGAVLLAHTNTGLNHHPEQPAGVSDAFYALAYEGASHSNLSGGSSLVDSIFRYMEDAGTSNFTTMGHRRWLLSDEVQQVGFGLAESTRSSWYSATYVIDNAASSPYAQDVAWPAPLTPLELFGNSHAWSVNLGAEYDNPQKDNLTVTLTQRSTGKQWTFDKDSDNLQVNNMYYGQGKCIIFRPDQVTYQDGDVFDVKIEGLSGKAESLEYSVEFFRAAEEVYDVTYDLNGASGFIPNEKPSKANRLVLPDSDGFVRFGYVFDGWKSSVTGEIYSAGETVTLTADTTFEAQWRREGDTSGSGGTSVPGDGNTSTDPDAGSGVELDTQIVYMIDGVSQYDFLVKGNNDTGDITVTSSNTDVATVVLQDGADSRGAKYRVTTHGTGEATITVEYGGESAAMDVVVYPKGGSITLDTVNYRMAPGDIYDIGVTITDGAGQALSGEQVQEMVRNGSLRVTDSRTGSVVNLSQLANGNFRVTGRTPGTCWITYEVIQNGEAVTHASVKVDVAAGMTQGGVATRDTSWWAQK